MHKQTNYFFPLQTTDSEADDLLRQHAEGGIINSSLIEEETTKMAQLVGCLLVT